MHSQLLSTKRYGLLRGPTYGKKRSYYAVLAHFFARGGLHPVVSQKSVFWQSGNKTARAVKLGSVRGLIGSARKGFIKKKVHTRPLGQD